MWALKKLGGGGVKKLTIVIVKAKNLLTKVETKAQSQSFINGF